MVLLFAVAVSWAVYELFLPHPTGTGSAPPTLRPGRSLPDPVELARRIREVLPREPEARWRPPRLDNRWKWIVIHHSGTFSGNAAIFDRYHAQQKDMENGLAYHFVIGNGTDSNDGEVEVGARWRRQLQGGHVRGDQLNQIAIGICLVGDFEQSIPTEKQIASLKGLLNFLLDVTSVDENRVRGHEAMPGQRTVCPGTFLPVCDVLRFRKTGVRGGTAQNPG